MGKCLTALSWIVQAIFGVAIPIASITVAAVYHDQCPAEPKINVYLYVSGVLGFISFIYALTFFCCAVNGSCGEGSCGASNVCAFVVIEVIIGIFLFAWLITGSVWVYRNHKTYKTGTLNCDDTLYLFAFTILTIQWVLVAIKYIIGCFTRKSEE